MIQTNKFLCLVNGFYCQNEIAEQLFRFLSNLYDNRFRNFPPDDSTVTDIKNMIVIGIDGDIMATFWG